MDVAMIAERIRILGAAGAVDALAALLRTPDVAAIGRAWQALAVAGPEQASLVAQEGKPRDPESISLQETELDPEIVRLLEKLELTTVAEVDRTDDDTLLKVKGLSLFRLEELRSVVRKYVGGAVAAPTYGPIWERVRARIEDALDEGLGTKEIVKRYKLHHLDVQRVLRERKTARRA